MTDRDGETAAAGGFRACGSCGRCWTTVQDFLHDPRLLLIGLQVAAHRPEANLIVFEHACGSSVSVLTGRLRALDPDAGAGGDFPDRYGSDECQGLCRQLDEWSSCDRPCVNARDRRLLQTIIDIKERSAT